MLVYLYIDNFNGILNQVSLDFGSKNIFKFKDNTIYIKGNSEFVNDLYRHYYNISNVSGVIGKNSSGKTTILRAINEIFTNNTDMEYIAIFEENDEFICVSSCKKRKVKFDKGIAECNIRMGRIEEIYKTNTLMYFSNIFDKSSIFKESEYCVDISTNSEVRKYVKDKFINSIEILRDNLEKDDLMRKSDKLQNEQSDIIEDFKQSEILKKIKYYNKLDELMNKNKSKDGKKLEFKPLFNFPQNLEISFGDDILNIDYLIDNIKNVDLKLVECFKIIHGLIDDLLLNNEILEVSNDEDKYINEFLSFLLFEVLYKVRVEYDCDIDFVIFKLSHQIKNKEIREINRNEFDKILDLILNREISQSELEDLVEKSFQVEKEEKVLEKLPYNINESVNNLIGVVDDKLNCLEEGCDLISLVDLHEIIIEINNLCEFLDGFNYNIQYSLTIEEIKKNNYIWLSNSNNKKDNLKVYMNLTDILEKYNGNDSIYVEDDTIFLYDYFLNINRLLNQIVVFFNDDKLEKKIEDDSEGVIEVNENELKEITVDYSEDDKEVISFINSIRELIEELNEIVKNNKVLNNGAFCTLSCDWRDGGLGRFIKSFTELKSESFYIVYDHEDLSSGQRGYLDMFSRIFEKIQEGKIDSNNNLVFLIDESDVYMHPSIQIEVVMNIMKFFSLFMENGMVQIILTSNSAFIASDIPHTNLIYVENKDGISISNNMREDCKTFGANIHNMLINNFYMDKGTVGCFANLIINDIIELLKDENINEDYQLELFKKINIIGEPIIREKLIEMYNNKFIKNKNIKEKLVNYYKNKIEELNEV